MSTVQPQTVICPNTKNSLTILPNHTAHLGANHEIIQVPNNGYIGPDGKAYPIPDGKNPLPNHHIESIKCSDSNEHVLLSIPNGSTLLPEVRKSIPQINPNQDKDSQKKAIADYIRSNGVHKLITPTYDANGNTHSVKSMNIIDQNNTVHNININIPNGHEINQHFKNYTHPSANVTDADKSKIASLVRANGLIKTV